MMQPTLRTEVEPSAIAGRISMGCRTDMEVDLEPEGMIFTLPATNSKQPTIITSRVLETHMKDAGSNRIVRI